MSAGVLGAETVSLKKCLVNEEVAFEIFKRELADVKPMMEHDDSLFFSFVSDPMLPETMELTMRCVSHALESGVPVQILTKCTSWVSDSTFVSILEKHRDIAKIGFTLTGMEAMESRCLSNTESRIPAMRYLKSRNIFTFASVEPVIDITAALYVIERSKEVCDLFKVGFVSKMGVKFTREDARRLVNSVKSILGNKPVFFKNSVTKILGEDV